MQGFSRQISGGCKDAVISDVNIPSASEVPMPKTSPTIRKDAGVRVCTLSGWIHREKLGEQRGTRLQQEDDVPSAGTKPHPLCSILTLFL